MSVLEAPTRAPQRDLPATTRAGRIPALIAVVAVIAGLIVSPPWSTGGGVPAGFAGRLISGDLERQAGDRWVVVTVGQLVPDGAEVRSRDGAELEVRGGVVELADATAATLADELELETGSVLTDVPDGQRSVRLGPLVASGRGTWRVDRGTADRVAVYAGGVGVQLEGDDDRGVALARLQEADVDGSQLPAAPLPIAYAPSDPWDARLLAELIATDRTAAQLIRSFTSRYGTAAQPPAFYRRFVIVDDAVAAGLSRLGGVTVAGRIGPPADVLLAAVVVDLLADRAGLQRVDAVDEVVAQRSAGATWGVVLARHDLGADDLREAVDLALRGAPAEPAITSPGPAPGGPGPADPGGEGSTGGEPDADPDDGPSRPPSDEPTDGPSDGDDEEPAPGPCQAEPCEPVNETVDDLTDIVDDVVPGAGQQLDDLVSELPTIIPPGGGIGDVVDDTLPEPSTVLPSAGETVDDVLDGATDVIEGTTGSLPDLP